MSFTSRARSAAAPSSASPQATSAADLALSRSALELLYLDVNELCRRRILRSTTHAAPVSKQEFTLMENCINKNMLVQSAVLEQQLKQK